MPRGRALVLAPHPDDEVLGCGGAIMRHIAANDAVYVVIVTDGAFGRTNDRGSHRRMREDESRRAAKVLGCDAPRFWGLPDRGLEYGEILIQRIVEALEASGADLVYAPSWWEMHPDHFTLALAAAEAVRRCPRAVRLLMYEVGVPLHPNCLLDITDILERKMAAIACFESQLAQQRYDRQIAALNAYRTYTLPSSVSAAEAYRILTQEDLRQDPLRSIRPGIYYTQTGKPETTPPPLVSIIVNWREESDWASTLDSIGLQTYSNIEVLVLSPLPEPNLPAFGGRYPMRQLTSAADSPATQSLNLALDQAQGELLILILEAARLEPDHVAAMTQALLDSPDVGFVYTGLKLEPWQSETAWSSRTLNRPVERHELWGGSSLPLSCCMIKSQLVSDGCRFDETLDFGYAWDFLVQLSRRSQLLRLERISVHIHDQQTPTDDEAFAALRHAEEASDAAFAKWQTTWSTSELREIIAVRDRLRAEAECTAQRLGQELQQKRLDLEQAYAETEALRHRLAESDRAHAALREEARFLAEQIAGRESEGRHQDAVIENLRQEVEALQGSTSWRITAPLRLLITRLRAVKH